MSIQSRIRKIEKMSSIKEQPYDWRQRFTIMQQMKITGSLSKEKGITEEEALALFLSQPQSFENYPTLSY